jgi:hypothetical protein
MGRISSYIIGVAAAASVVTTSVQAEEALDLFSSRGHELAFAIDNVCMPSLRQGGAVAALAGRSGVPADLDGRPGVRLHGFGRVLVSGDAGGCTIVVRDGDGRAARGEALEVLEHGYLLETLVGPNEPVLHSLKWSGLGEAYCFRLDEKVVEADIITSRDQDRDNAARGDALRLRLYWSDAEALKKGVCKA